jgi:hypothetical protein
MRRKTVFCFLLVMECLTVFAQDDITPDLEAVVSVEKLTE